MTPSSRLPFDVADTILGYQGLPTATSLRWFFSGNVDRGKTYTSHSLGTLDHTNLQKWGVLARGGGVNALPIGNIAPSGLDTFNLGVRDLVGGSFLGWVLNPESRVTPSPSWAPWNYPFENHYFRDAYAPFQ